MASKRRLRRNACKGKVAYATEKEGVTAKMRMQNFAVHTYKCTFCGKFHLGHRPAKVRRAIAQGKRDKEIG